MPVEFISVTFPNAATEINPGPNPTQADSDFIRRYATALDEYGFDYTVGSSDDRSPRSPGTGAALTRAPHS